MVVLTAETCWALNEYWIYNKISGIKLVSLYSTIEAEGISTQTRDLHLYICGKHLLPSWAVLVFFRQRKNFWYWVLSWETLFLRHALGPLTDHWKSAHPHRNYSFRYLIVFVIVVSGTWSLSVNNARQNSEEHVTGYRREYDWPCIMNMICTVFIVAPCIS